MRDGGPIRVAEVADLLAISRPSAHRLLRALVARDFLTQDDSRRYLATAGLLAPAIDSDLGGRLRYAAGGPMSWLSRVTGTSSNLLIRVGGSVRFLSCVTVAGGTPDRTGLVEPVQVTSGGRALLAQFDDARLQALLLQGPSGAAPELTMIRRSVMSAKAAGYATANRPAEHLVAVGVAIEGASVPQARAALTVSIPAEAPLPPGDLEDLVAPLQDAAARIAAELALVA